MKLLESTRALIRFRPNLKGNLKLAEALPYSEAIEQMVLLVGLTREVLTIATTRPETANYIETKLRQADGPTDFQQHLARQLTITWVEVCRLIVQVQIYSPEVVLKAIQDTYPESFLEIASDLSLVTVISREESLKEQILIQKIEGSCVKILHTSANGKKLIDERFRQKSFRQEIAQKAGLPPGAEKNLLPIYTKIGKEQFLLIFNQVYPEIKYEGLSQNEERRYAQTIRQESQTYSSLSGTFEEKKVALVDESEIKKLFYNIARSGFLQNASDIRIYFDPALKRILHKVKIDGDWKTQGKGVHSEYDDYMRMINIIIKESEAGNNQLLFKPKNGEIYFQIAQPGELSSNFNGRVAIFPYIDTRFRKLQLAMITIRIHRDDEEIREITTLGLLEFQYRMVQKFIEASTGLLLVVGVMGSGKNGTLVSLSQEINRRFPERDFVTIEDPVEIRMPFAFQCQVASAQNMTPNDYLPTILRSAVDIIQMGEINDPQKADFALKAAQSGHYTQATLHAGSVFDILQRLELYGVPRAMLAESLIGVIYQKLVPKLCSVCSLPEDMTNIWDNPKYALLKTVLNHWKDFDLTTFRPKRATGILSNGELCPKCSYQNKPVGYKGRTAVFEIWDPSFQRKQLQENHTIGQIRTTALKLGHWTILHSAMCLVSLGIIDLATALKVYNGIDPTYEGVPGYQFEDYEHHNSQEEAMRYRERKSSQTKTQDDSVTTAMREMNELLEVVDAELCDLDSLESETPSS